MSFLMHVVDHVPHRIAEVGSSDGQVYEAPDDLSEPRWVAHLTGVGTKLHGSVQRSRDGLTAGHPEFEEHIQHVMTLCEECRAEAIMKTENRKQRERRKRRFNGSLESRTVRGRERERVREKTNRKPSIQNSNTIQSISLIYMCVCLMHTFIQVLTRTDRSTIVLQCS